MKRKEFMAMRYADTIAEYRPRLRDIETAFLAGFEAAKAMAKNKLKHPSWIKEIPYIGDDLICSCGGTVLADTEEWKNPVCNECYERMGNPLGDE